MWCVAVGVWRCIYVTVLGPSPAEGVCVWSGGVARWDDIPIRAVYNASQDDGYLELVVVPMMLRAGCGVRHLRQTLAGASPRLTGAAQ